MLVVQASQVVRTGTATFWSSGSEASIWSQLREASERLGDGHPNHPVTTDVSEM